MSAATRDCAAAALALPARARAALARDLLASLPPRQKAYDLEAVLAKRVKEVRGGTAVTVPAGEALRDIRSRLGRRA
jgi:hypothetical protein